jgi:hypothetical protein
MADEHVEALTRLNGLYIQAAMRADGDLFDTILADDFLCSQSDGTLVDRAEFIRRTRASSPLLSLDIDDVRIRVLGDIAIIHARTTYALADGRPGTGRYTDVWARRGGGWLAVSAHVTRLVSLR